MKKIVMVVTVALLSACSDEPKEVKVEKIMPKPPIVIEQPEAKKEEPKRKYAKGGMIEKMTESKATPASLLNF